MRPCVVLAGASGCEESFTFLGFGARGKVHKGSLTLSPAHFFHCLPETAGALGYGCIANINARVVEPFEHRFLNVLLGLWLNVSVPKLSRYGCPHCIPMGGERFAAGVFCDVVSFRHWFGWHALNKFKFLDLESLKDNISNLCELRIRRLYYARPRSSGGTSTGVPSRRCVVGFECPESCRQMRDNQSEGILILCDFAHQFDCLIDILVCEVFIQLERGFDGRARLKTSLRGVFGVKRVVRLLHCTGNLHVKMLQPHLDLLFLSFIHVPIIEQPKFSVESEAQIT